MSRRHTGVMATVIAPGGDVDIAAVAALFADRTRARVLVALSDGRALPASVLATEAGVSPQAASAQLSRLQAAGLLAVEQSGRHRYYRLATGQVSAILEALAQLAPAQPVRSLRQSTRAAALRSARACYDHLAGKLGVELTQALIDHRALTPTDGIPDTRRRPGDRISSQLTEHPWVLGRPRPRSSPGSASRRTGSPPPARHVGRCCGSASTGASSATTWPASSGPTSWPRCSTPAGSAARKVSAPSGSPRPGGRRSAPASDLTSRSRPCSTPIAEDQNPAFERTAVPPAPRHVPPATGATEPVGYAIDRSEVRSPTPSTRPIGVAGVADRLGFLSLA